MKKLLFITLSLLTATIIVTVNNTTIKDTKTAEVKTVEVVEQVEPIVKAEEVSIIQPVEQVTIEEPKIITEDEKNGYILSKYIEFSNYFYTHSPSVQNWFNHYFFSNPEKFTYELVDVKMSKIKAHFIDMKYRATLIEVVERAKSLVL